MSRNRIAAGLARKTGQSYQTMLRTSGGGRQQAVVIACASPAGGEGKTITVVHLAAALAQRGVRVLAVDCDPQGDLHWTLTRGQAEPVSRSTPWTKVNDERHGRIGVAQAPMLGRDARQEIRRLRDVLRPARRRFDLVLLDSPPGPQAAGVARNSDALIVPVDLGVQFWVRPTSIECASLYTWLDESFGAWLDEHDATGAEEPDHDGFAAAQEAFLASPSVQATLTRRWPGLWPQHRAAWIEYTDLHNQRRGGSGPVTVEQVVNELTRRIPVGRGPMRGGARPHLLGLVLNRVPSERLAPHGPLDQAAVSVPVFETRIPKWEFMDELADDLASPVVVRQYSELAAELGRRVAGWRPTVAAVLSASAD